MKTILVTGGCGFIGSNFINDLLTRSDTYSIICLDALTYAGNIMNLEACKDNERLTFSRTDIRDRKAVDSLFVNHEIHHVVNFAAESHVDRSIADSAIFLETNVLGTHCLLEATRKHGVERYVQVSTDEVYGALGPDDPPFTESTPLHPNNPYSASKAAADLLVMVYCNTHGFPGIITRCSNNYGPYQHPEKLIPVVLSKIAMGEQIPVYGKGANIRDWIHVSDHCSGILAALERGKIGEIYNFGGNAEIMNLDLVKMILTFTGKPETLISFVADRAGHDFRYAINHSKATKELEWQPRISLMDGIRTTISWYQDNRVWVENILSCKHLRLNLDYAKFFSRIH